MPEPLVVRAVVDTNLLVRGILRRRPSSAAVRLFDAIDEGRLRLVTCQYILDELRETLIDPEIRAIAPNLSIEIIEQILKELRTEADFVPGDFDGDFVPENPKDNPIVACALEADAGYLVTEDRGLLALGARRLAAFRPVRIVYAKKFLELLERGDA